MTIKTTTTATLNSRPAISNAQQDRLMGAPAKLQGKEAALLHSLKDMKSQLSGLKAEIKELKAGQNKADQFVDSDKKFCVQPRSNWMPKDVGALVELNKLNQTSGPISAEQMADTIDRATSDLDGQAASTEYRTVADWAMNNRERLTPEAKQVMDIYSKYAALSQARGESGIPQDDFKKMLGEMRDVGDASAKKALANLDRKGGTVSGEDMAKAITAGTADHDGQAAGAEAKEFEKWAAKNESRLSPEAKEVLDVYRKHTKAAQAKGQTGLTDKEAAVMNAEMKKAGAVDVSARKATESLDQKKGPISGQDMAKAIQKGTADLDGQAAGAELKEFERWAAKNQSKLSPEAKEVLDVYRKHTKAAQAKGQTGLTAKETAVMNAEMKKVGAGDVSARKATAALDKEQGPISGEDLTQAIRDGISDTDAHSTTSELKEFEKWAAKNESRLTPEAKEVLKAYQSAAKKAGPDGLTQKEADAMFKKMDGFKTFRDDSMRAALEGLDGKSGKINGKDLTAAIEKGAADLDGQAAGLEFTDTMKWARQNYDRLTPDAKKVVDTYEKYATRAQAKGSTGIDQNDFNKMLKEMKLISNPPPARPVYFAA
ncbi:hypothetical protein OV207_01265 [Corallococcus sp. BB11-1]|uniref:hypothetical protein n=1 Tax=Corallococcus sp. BB11-1 TaxID=2996783 RepID=UPI002271DDCA|nr:hypothetical protein [Corallococcus sp. BB11-1]MCY1030074.1 hypothetical protein [Corallococcus sp. BB11-1]